MEQLQYQLSVREIKESNSTWSHGQKGIIITLLDQKGRKGNQGNGNSISLVESQYNNNKYNSFPQIPPFYK